MMIWWAAAFSKRDSWNGRLARMMHRMCAMKPRGEPPDWQQYDSPMIRRALSRREKISDALFCVWCEGWGLRLRVEVPISWTLRERRTGLAMIRRYCSWPNANTPSNPDRYHRLFRSASQHYDTVDCWLLFVSSAEHLHPQQLCRQTREAKARPGGKYCFLDSIYPLTSTKKWIKLSLVYEKILNYDNLVYLPKL